MTRKDYRVIADAVIEAYYREIKDFRSTSHTASTMNILSKKLNSAYSNFDTGKWHAYIQKEIREN